MANSDWAATVLNLCHQTERWPAPSTATSIQFKDFNAFDAWLEKTKIDGSTLAERGIIAMMCKLANPDTEIDDNLLQRAGYFAARVEEERRLFRA